MPFIWRPRAVSPRHYQPATLRRTRRSATGRGIRGRSPCHRVPTTHFGRSGLAGRGIDYLSFYNSAGRLFSTSLGRRHCRCHDRSSPPFNRRNGSNRTSRGAFGELATRHISRSRRPTEGTCFARSASRTFLASCVTDLCERLRPMSLSGNVCAKDPVAWLTDGSVHVIHELVRRRGNSSGRLPTIRYAANGGSQASFVVGYSGNLGRVHEFDTVLAAAEHLRDDPHIVFLFIGGGKKMTSLRLCPASASSTIYFASFLIRSGGC